MKKIFDKTSRLIFNQQGGMVSSASILAVMIIISRIFGFLRYRILAGYYTKNELDILFASFRVPDLVFEILITGAFTASFIPIYIRYKDRKEELDPNISTIFNLIFVFLTAFMAVNFFFMDALVKIITPGYDIQKITQIAYYSRLLLIGQLPLLVIGNFLTGIGQANRIFLITAVAPVLYNISVIIVTLFFNNTLGLLAPVAGVIVGAGFFLLIQLPVLNHARFSYTPVIKLTQGVRDFLRMVVPRIFTVVVSQIDATVDLVLTSMLGTGAYTVFYFAQHLHLLPVSIIGISLGQASLPYLTEMVENKKTEEMKKVIIDTLLSLVFLVLPFAAFFFFARTPIVRLFFGGEKFDWNATVNTAYALSYFSIAIPFHGVYYFLTRCFYALMDSRTPFYIGILTVFFNALLSVYLSLVLKLPVYSLSLAFSISMAMNVTLLILLLSKRLNGFPFVSLFWGLMKIGGAVAGASLIGFALMKAMTLLFFDTSRTINIFIIILVDAIVFAFFYLFFAWLLEVREIFLVTRLILKIKEYQKKLVEIYTTYE